MFITPAYAQSVGGDQPSILISFLPLIAVFAIFYFLVIRPQQRKVKDHQAKISAVRRNDTVVTSGGLRGKVTKLLDNGDLEVEIAKGIKVKVVKHMLADVVSKTEVVTDTK